MKKNFLKLLVCYHKPDTLVKDEIFTPIHVGRSLAKKRAKEGDKNLEWMLKNTIGDDTGDNISDKNMSYNELTALYWAWKNYDKIGNPEYIGLCHYRRYFIFRDSEEVVETIRDIDENFFNYINYNKKSIEDLFKECDYIAHIGHVDGVFKHYKEHHHAEDLELAVKIVKEKYPDFASTADDYLKMSFANFFNMFILPRDLFFKYCEWLFDVLAEFEKQVDLSEKRLFISERLTGIFIEKLKRDGFKQKSLSVAFVDAPSRTPVALPYCKEKFKTTVTINSIFSNAREGSLVDFYICHTSKDEINQNEFKTLLDKYPGNTITYVNVEEKLMQKGINPKKFNFPEHYPLVLAEVIDKPNKVLYLNERCLIFGDIATLYRECNNDEFRVIGFKNSEDESNPLYGDIFCLHTGRLRTHQLIKEFLRLCKDKTSAEVFNQTCLKHIGGFAWWNYSITNLEKDGKMTYDRHRGDTRWDNAVWNKPILYYAKGMEPWANIQALYSVYWWEYAQNIPASIPCDVFEDDIYSKFYDESLEICYKNSIAKKPVEPNMQYVEPTPTTDANVYRKQKQPSAFTKTKWYYQTHGFKATIKRAFQKLFGGKK